MTNVQEAYLTLSRASGFEVGDTVKIVRSVPSEYLGWSAVWQSKMDKCIGEIGTIEIVYTEDKFSGFSGFRVAVNGYSWSFPFFSLELVRKGALPVPLSMVGKEVEVKIDGKTFTAKITKEK